MPPALADAPVAVIAGPCAVESREQIQDVAHVVRDAGGSWLRGGAFKPRTSPYSFQGLGLEGLELLREAGEQCGLVHSSTSSKYGLHSARGQAKAWSFWQE